MSRSEDAKDGARDIAHFEQLCADPALAALKDHLARATGALGFESFLFCDLPAAAPVDQMTFVTNYSPDWMRRYLRNDYRAHDLAAINAAQLRRPFTWAEVQDRRNLTREQTRVVDESQTFGLRYGATLPAAGPLGRMSALNVAARMSGADFEKLFAARRRNLEDLHLMASEKLRRIGIKARPGTGDAAPDRPRFRLTPHEIASLTHAARGLTRQQIAEAMDISINTVKEHLETVLDKLKARNTTHAVSIAMQAGVIWP